MDQFSGTSDINDATSKTPVVLFMGPSHSGKTSIQQVVFARMSPHETQFSEPTTQPTGCIYPPPSPKVDSEALLRCRLMDLPGKKEHLDAHKSVVTTLLRSTRCLIFVIDTQDETTWDTAIKMLLDALNTLKPDNSSSSSSSSSPPSQCNVSVLLHKCDPDSSNTGGGRNVDQQSSSYTKLRQKIMSSLHQNNVPIPVTFYITTLFNTSIYEALSRVFHSIIEHSQLLSSLLDGLSAACEYNKAILVDFGTKLYIAGDTNNDKSENFSPLLSQLLDLITDVSSVYSTIPIQDDSINTLQSSQSAANEQGMLNPSDPLSKNNDIMTCYNSEIEFNNGNTLLLRQLNSHTVLLVSYTNKPLYMVNLQEYNLTCFKQAVARICNVKIYGIENDTNDTANNATMQAVQEAFGVKQYMGSYASYATSNVVANIREQVGSLSSYHNQQQFQNSDGSFVRSPSVLNSSSRVGIGISYQQQQLQQPQQQQMPQFTNGIASSYNIQPQQRYQ